MQISRMVLVCDVKISQLGRKILPFRFSLISDPPRHGAKADGVELNNSFGEMYSSERTIILGGEVRLVRCTPWGGQVGDLKIG